LSPQSGDPPESAQAPPRTLLLTGARDRLRLAGLAIACLWAAVLWAILSRPSPPPQAPRPQSAAATLRLVVASGQAAPNGGSFDRFDVGSQPIVAPVNAAGAVAFYAALARAKASEGMFLATASGIVKVAVVGDAVPGGGTVSEFAKHPIPALNDAGAIAFGAAIAGARASEGIFLAKQGSLKVVALSGDDAPGIATGTFVEFDTPALNNNNEIVFVASVRRGREALQALYLYSGGKLRKLVGEGDPVPGGGRFEKFGVPTINNKGLVAFPAVLDHAAVPGGIFLTGSQSSHLLVGVGAPGPGGTTLARFSERVAINDDDNLALNAHLTKIDAPDSEAIFLANAATLEQVARSGDAAPGGGKFSGFGAWPGIGGGRTVSFVAALDGGPGPLGIFQWQSGAMRRVAFAGERLDHGRALAGFALNPVASAGPDGAVTFATVAEPGAGQSGIYCFGPTPAGS
jgi:hypothetical protein